MQNNLCKQQISQSFIEISSLRQPHLFQKCIALLVSSCFLAVMVSEVDQAQKELQTSRIRGDHMQHIASKNALRSVCQITVRMNVRMDFPPGLSKFLLGDLELWIPLRNHKAKDPYLDRETGWSIASPESTDLFSLAGAYLPLKPRALFWKACALLDWSWVVFGALGAWSALDRIENAWRMWVLRSSMSTQKGSQAATGTESVCPSPLVRCGAKGALSPVQSAFCVKAKGGTITGRVQIVGKHGPVTVKKVVDRHAGPVAYVKEGPSIFFIPQPTVQNATRRGEG